MLNKTAEILDLLNTEKLKDVTKEQLEIICEKLQELNIRQRKQLEENIDSIGELDHYCFRWACGGIAYIAISYTPLDRGLKSWES